MEKTTEKEQVLNASTGEKIVRVEIIDDGHAIKIYSVLESNDETVQISLSNEEVNSEINEKYFEEMFPIVEVDKISLEDEFMKHEPESENQKRVKAAIIKAKEIGFKNFRRPAIDPSFSDDGKNIVYEKGKKPAVGKSAKWWKEIFKDFMPSKNSMMGTQMHYDVFLGTLIKYLVEDREYSVSDAWKAVCNQSKELGHYWDSKDAKHDFELTGSRQIGKWYDLGNTCKITANDTKASGFSLVGGNYICNSYYYPLAVVDSLNFPNCEYFISVGWLVLSV